MASAREEKRQLEEDSRRRTAAATEQENGGLPTNGHGQDQQYAPLPGHELDSEPLEHEIPPPAYGEHLGQIHGEKDGFGTKASIGDDGRVNIRFDQHSRRMTQLLAPTMKQISDAAENEQAPPPPYIPPSLGGQEGVPPPPPMNVVIQIVGSRGDVQPFVALAKVLQDRYRHRVRLATHPNFKDFVTENGIEFFNIGGDPASLMAFMVKNPGLMPGFDSLKAGDVGKRRKEIAEYIEGCWRSCFESGNGMGPPEVADDNAPIQPGRSGIEGDSQKPFVADCIIANPPSFAHIHLSERLGIPLHIFFTMPYSPTQSFPHPLANIQASNADENLTNYISYSLVDMMTWQGLGDIINKFRTKSLGLDEMSIVWAPGVLGRLKIPHTYTWSPALIPKPRDWGATVSISGFFFLDLAKNYTPAPDLKAFLEAGPPPVYIGFGSIVLDDPDGMTKLIFEAVQKSGQRALVSKGWGGVGADKLGVPDSVFMLGNVPHDWLFKNVSCVVHHGGAGTTAAGITAGRPTLVVPFFGDQPFWGAMIARAGAGPDAIPHKKLTADNLAAGIMKCLEPQMQGKAQEMAMTIAKEKGTEVGAQYFHQFLEVDQLRCNLIPSRAAVWTYKRTPARLCAMAAHTLITEGLIELSDLRPFRPREFDIDQGPSDPLSGGATAVMGTFSSMIMGVADLPGQAVGIMKKSGSKSEGKKPEDVTVSAEATRSAHGNSPESQGQSLADSRGVQEGSAQASKGGGASKAATIGGKGMGKFVGAAAAAPMDFSVSMTKGFHNAPKLYGDKTVRDTNTKVTGWRSGMVAAGKEFGFGMYDGVTGLFTQPYKGAKQEGGIGFLKGFGKGVGGFALKPSAALFAIPGYTMKGVYKEMKKAFGGNTAQNLILAARAAQGYDEHQQASAEERKDVVMRWKALEKDLKSGKKKNVVTPNVPIQQPNQQSNERPKMEGVPPPAPASVGTGSAMLTNENVPRSVGPEASMLAVIDNKPSLAPLPPMSSNATRVQHLQATPEPSVDEMEEEQLRRAIAESSAEAQRQQTTHDDELQRAMAESMKLHHEGPINVLDDKSDVLPSPGLSEATLPSQQPVSSAWQHDPGHLGGMTRADFERQQAQRPGEKTQAEKTRDEMMMEYVKEQSLREEELRRETAAASSSQAG